MRQLNTIRAKTFLTTLAAAAVLALLLPGCGGGPAVSKVTGKVTVDGVPRKGITITFQPTKGRPAEATTDADGNFELTYKPGVKGALLGEHKVMFSQTQMKMNETTKGQEMVELLPKKYNEESTITYTVNAGTNAPFNYDIKTK